MTFRQLLTHCRPGASAVLLALAATSAHAGGTALWSTTNVEYLYSSHYNPIFGTSKERSVVTLEHADGWKYGDNFFFIDVTNADREDDQGARASFYGELSPRLSFGKILGKDLSVGPFSDFLFTSTLEIPQYNGFPGTEQVYLYGLAADFKLPIQFAFLQLNFYRRDNQASAYGDGYQATLAWGIPIAAGPVLLSFEGFLDYAFDQKGLEDNIISAPRLLLDVGNFLGKPGCVQVGVEYQIWRNQFGVKDEDEDAAQAMIKWILN